MTVQRRVPARQRGFALLLVIWVLAVLAVLAAGLAASTHSETALARNGLEAARARALAEAGIARAMAGLLEPDPLKQWHPDGRTYQVEFAGGKITLRIEDEGGKFDLNTTPPELLANLCAELEIDADASAALLAAIVERRAAIPAAARAPAPGLPSRLGLFPGLPFGLSEQRRIGAAAFGTVEELRQIEGVERDTFERLRPYLTVYAQTPVINPQTASRELLLAVPRIDRAQVEQYLLRRAEPPARDQRAASLPVLAGGEGYLGALGFRAATILARALTDSGASTSRRAVISLTNQPANPIRILEWRQDVDAGGSP